ncbi:MAG: sensor histidine kinase, partial [Bacteroidetes bacterium]
PEAGQVDLVQTLKRQVQNMQVLVDELLMLAQSGEKEPECTRVPMDHLAQEVLQDLNDQIRGRQAQVRQTPLPEAWGRSPWLATVWGNLITNALKYAGPCPQIDIGGKAVTGHKVRFWVMDRGPGLPPGSHRKIFLPKVRLPDTNHMDGHGLGLSIVRRIIQKLGGKIWAENRPGGGASFVFELPESHQPLLPSQVPVQDQEALATLPPCNASSLCTSGGCE